MILEVKDIDYAYKNRGAEQVLHHVSAQFEKGSFYAITGSSGAGKTTFLSLLAGLDTPTGGSVLYNGENIQTKGLNYHRQHHVAIVFQNYNLIDYLTTEENVKLGGSKDAARLLSAVNIPSDTWKRNVLQLSGGQQQRVAIARALASDAPVILADEPTGNLDEDTAAEITAILKGSAHSQQKCVIVVTHSTDVANQADVVLELKRGQLTEKKRI